MNQRLKKIIRAISYLNIDYNVVDNYLTIRCNEMNYDFIFKFLLFHCYEFRVLPSPPIDDHFTSIFIEIHPDWLIPDII